MIIGTGIDIINVERLERAVTRYGERFIRKVFTDAETAYSGNRVRRFEHLAARFAAKEAVLKALGTGVARGALLRDVEVINNAAGKPEVMLHGATRRLAEERGVARLHLSLSHTDRLAVAQAIAENAG